MNITYTFHPDGTSSGWCAGLGPNGLGLKPSVGSCPIFKDGRTCQTCPSFADPFKGSRYVVSNVVFQNLEDLIECLEELFGKGTVERSLDGENSLEAFDYQSKCRTEEIGLCAAVIRRGNIGSSSNDFPVVKREDGYHIVISNFDVTAIPRRLGWSGMNERSALEGRILQECGANQAMKKLRRVGYSPVKERGEDGKIRIKMSHKASATTAKSSASKRSSRFGGFGG